WASAGALFEPRWEPVAIPYYGGKPPGWLLRPGKGKRPTVIVNSGSDAQNIDMYVYRGGGRPGRGGGTPRFGGAGAGSHPPPPQRGLHPRLGASGDAGGQLPAGAPESRQAPNLADRAKLRRLLDAARRRLRAPGGGPCHRPRRPRPLRLLERQPEIAVGAA